MKHRSDDARRAGLQGGPGNPPDRDGPHPGTNEDQNARPWHEHEDHVPREFEQGGRRAQYRTEGEHANDDARYGDAHRWPSRVGDGTIGPDRPHTADGDRPVGNQGYPRDDAGDTRGAAAAGPSQGTEGSGGTSGYDDYETEALYGAGFERGDWPRTWERGEHHSAVRTDDHARGEDEPDPGPDSDGKHRTHRTRGG